MALEIYNYLRIRPMSFLLYQFQESQRGGVAPAGRETDNAGIAASPLFIACGQFGKDLFDYGLIFNYSHGLAPGMKVSPFTQGNNFLGQGLDLLGAAKGSLDTLVSKKGLEQI